MSTWHLDTSALGRLRQPAVRRRIAAISGEGAVARCGLVDLEIVRFAPGRRVGDVELRLAAFGEVSLVQADLDRAREVQRKLAAGGQHHGTPALDLVIAAVAERAGATLIHYDADFDRIAEVTGQSVEWVVPRGEAD